ncbi:MAG: type II CAAX endopeptidase family protein [bacterium]|nr:type II CAAX endopeptidase family protein [bacterium]
MNIKLKNKNIFFNIIKDIVIFISFFLIMQILVILFKSYLNKHNSLFSIIIYLIMCLYLFLIYKKNLINDLKDFKKNYKKYISKSFKIFIICLFLMYISNIIITQFTGDIATNESLNRELVKYKLLYSVIEMCFLAPFYEEILFRLNFKNLFKNKIIFSIITGLFFGSMHLLVAKSSIELLHIIPYSIMGFALSYIFYDTDNIFTSITYHFFNNFGSILLLMLAGSI